MTAPASSSSTRGGGGGGPTLNPAAPPFTAGGGAKKPSAAAAGVFELKGRFERAPVQELVGHRKRVQCLAFSAGGSHLASGASDGSVRVWATSTQGGSGLPLLSSSASAELRGHEKDVTGVAWNPSTEHQLASCGRGDKVVRLWDARGKGSETAKISGGVGAGGPDWDKIAWSPDGRYLAAIVNQDLLVTLDVRKGQAVGRPRTMKGIDTLAWAPSSQALFIGIDVTYSPGLVEIWAHPRLKILHSFTPHTGPVHAMAIDKSATHMAMGSHDGLVSIWDLESLICLRTMDRLNHDVLALAFSHDGRLLAVGAEDCPSVDITEVATGRQVCALANGPSVPSLAWHPHALVLAYAAEGTGAGDVGGLGPGSIGVPGGGFGSLAGGGGGDRGRGLKEENVRVVSVLE